MLRLLLWIEKSVVIYDFIFKYAYGRTLLLLMWSVFLCEGKRS